MVEGQSRKSAENLRQQTVSAVGFCHGPMAMLRSLLTTFPTKKSLLISPSATFLSRRLLRCQQLHIASALSTRQMVQPDDASYPIPPESMHPILSVLQRSWASLPIVCEHTPSALFSSIIQRVLLAPPVCNVLLPTLLLMTGKSKHHGKNKRPLKPANHGARPCNHVGRHARRLPRISWKKPKCATPQHAQTQSL